MFDQPVASVQTTLVFLGGVHFSGVQVFVHVCDHVHVIVLNQMGQVERSCGSYERTNTFSSHSAIVRF